MHKNVFGHQLQTINGVPSQGMAQDFFGEFNIHYNKKYLWYIVRNLVRACYAIAAMHKKASWCIAHVSFIKRKHICS